MKKIFLLVALLVTSFSLANAQLVPEPFPSRPGYSDSVYNPSFPDPEFHVDVWTDHVLFSFSKPVTEVTVTNTNTGKTFWQPYSYPTTCPSLRFRASNGTWSVTARYADGMHFGGRFLINRGPYQVGVDWLIDGDPYVTYHFFDEL